MTAEVTELVLEDNRLQALALSVAEMGGARAMGAQIRLIESLEAMGGLDRRTEGLAANDMLSRRAADGFGLTRPELAILLSSAKLVLQDAVEASELATDPAAEDLLLGDFPASMRGPFRSHVLGHQLRREIVGTVVANNIVNRMGILHPFELAEEEGAGLDQVGCAFVTAGELFGMNAIWQAADTASMPEGARLMLYDQSAHALRGHMADLLRGGGCSSPSQLVKAIGPTVKELASHVDTLLGSEARDHVEAITGRMAASGVPPKLANLVGRLFAMDGASGLAMLARDTGLPAVELADAFITLGSELGLDWAQSTAASMNPTDPWDRLLVAGLARDFQQMRFDFLRQLANGRSKASLDERLGKWLDARQFAVSQFRSVVARAQASTPVTPSILAQIASQARNVLQA